MQHGDFRIGMEFRVGDGVWRVTDIGTHTVIAIRIDRFNVGGTDPSRTLDRAAAEADGWFNGPPYAVCESVFDESDMAVCQPA